jgi:heat shock protein HslJ
MRYQSLFTGVAAFLLLTSSFATTGCDRVTGTAKKQRTDLLEGTMWSIQEVSTRSGSVHDLRGKGFAIAFVDLVRFSAHAGCNTLHGRYDTYTDGHFAATVDRVSDRECDQDELAALREALSTADRYRLQEGDLYLYQRSRMVMLMTR